MSDWQTIKTAPRDGTNVLILCGETMPKIPRIHVGSFAGRASCEALGYSEMHNGGWLYWGDDTDFYVIDALEATHWMPLPVTP